MSANVQDVANNYKAASANDEKLAPGVAAYSPPKVTANAKAPAPGAPSFWQRMQVDGVRLAKTVADNVAGAGKEVYSTARGVAATGKLPGTTYNPKAATNATKAEQTNQNAFNKTKSTLTSAGNSIVKPIAKTDANVFNLGVNTLEKLSGQKTTSINKVLQGSNVKAIKAVGDYVGKPDNVKQMIGNAVQTGLLLIPGEAVLGKAVDVGGKFLLDKLGTDGIEQLANKAGLKVGENLADEAYSKLADDLAKTSVGKQAVKTLSKTAGGFLGRLAKNTAKSAAGFGSFNAAAAASSNESNKNIVKAGVKGAEVGAIAGAGGTILKGVVDRTTGKTEVANKIRQMASDHQQATAKADATNKFADERGLPQGSSAKSKLLNAGNTTKELPQGEKVMPKNESTVTVKGEAGTPKTIPLAKGEYEQRLDAISKSYDKETKAAQAVRSPLKQQTMLDATEKKHMDLLNQLDHEDKNGKVNPDYKAPTSDKKVQTGFVTKSSQTSQDSQIASTKITQIDKTIANAQKNGTAKSASELRDLMRQRQDLTDVVAGKKTMADLSKDTAKSKLLKNTETTQSTIKETPTAKPIATIDQHPADRLIQAEKQKSAGMGESGGVRPGAVNEDVKAYLDKSAKGSKASGNIQHDAQVHDAESKQRLTDSAKLLKKVGNVSKEDKEAVWKYREAKAAGTELPKLTENQQALHDTTTAIVNATNKNKQELVNLKAPGYSKDSIYDPESGNHRIALGKGSAPERFIKGRQKTPLSGRSLRTSASSSKARVYYSVTDEEGNRSVAAIKNVSVKQGIRNVPKGKFVNTIDENGNSTRLGKITPSELKNGSFVGKDGKTYTVGQATTDEITKATGQQYVKDPLTSALIDYHETANALASSRMLESWKTSPDFEDIAIKHGEGTPPKGWKTTKLPQMQGYSFDPKVAETLDDIYGNIRDKVQAASAINHLLRTTMVAIPIRHNLNEIGFYFTDRGASALINPAAYKRGGAALMKAFNDVLNQSEDYRKAVSSGFNFMYTDDKAFSDQIGKQMKGMLDDQNTAEKVAADMHTTVVSLRQAWNAVQHKGVWFQQDVLNMARINERMASGPLKKGMSLEEAVAETEKFNPQYRVPSRVAGSRAASQVLRNNNILFFGSYHYDQWKAIANTLGNAVGKSGVKSAAQAWDKLGAMALGVYASYAFIDKGLQKISGNANAYTKPFGVLDLPSQLYQLATGQKDISSVIQSQIFPSVGLQVIAQLFENRDFFTGKVIRNAGMPASFQIGQIKNWLVSQLPTSQQVTNAKRGGSATAVALSLAGARFPANSNDTNNLNSLKYDTLPNVQSIAKKQAQSGNISGANNTISQYDKVVLVAAKKALQSAGKPVPDDQTLIRQLKKQQYYYQPKALTIKKWTTERPTSVVNSL